MPPETYRRFTPHTITADDVSEVFDNWTVAASASTRKGDRKRLEVAVGRRAFRVILNSDYMVLGKTTRLDYAVKVYNDLD